MKVHNLTLATIETGELTNITVVDTQLDKFVSGELPDGKGMIIKILGYSIRDDFEFNKEIYRATGGEWASIDGLSVIVDNVEAAQGFINIAKRLDV